MPLGCEVHLRLMGVRVGPAAAAAALDLLTGEGVTGEVAMVVVAGGAETAAAALVEEVAGFTAEETVLLVHAVAEVAGRLPLAAQPIRKRMAEEVEARTGGMGRRIAIRPHSLARRLWPEVEAKLIFWPSQTGV